MSAEGNDYVHVTCYAQVEPTWQYSNRDLTKSVKGASVVRLTQTHPRQPIGGTVLVKLALKIPSAAFVPLQAATAVVPLEAALPVLVEVGE
jgi:hypothetical protein